MGLDRPIDITAEQRKTLLALLRQHLPGTTAWVYGSRVKWTARPESDLDLVVFATHAQERRVSDLRDAFEESSLPFRVDLFVWDSIPEQFRERIEQEHVVLVEKVERGEVDGWQKVSVEQVADKVAMGPFGSSIKVNTFVPEGIPIISGQHLHGTRVDDAPGFNFITQKHAEKLANANVHRGDVVFTHAGNIGQVAYISENSKYDRYVISQRQFYMRCDRSKVIPDFIALYFKSPEGQHQLLANASQVGVPSIAQPVTYLRTITIPLPPLPEQRAIAHILGTLDDKIELNRRMNETLEAMARALFKSWFVDFDPVRAKMEGRDTGLPRHVADLFPDRLVESELGEIPEGWGVKALGECFNLTMGQSPPGSTYNEYGDGLPFFQGRTDFGFRYPENRKFCTAPTRIAHPGDTLVSVRAPVGDINMAWERSCVGRGVAALRHKSDKLSFSYYSAWAIQEQLREHDHMGTVFGAINKGQFEALQMIEPKPNVIDAFDSYTSPLDKRIRANIAESRALAALRDALLPKLISGEQRIRKIEVATP